MRSLPTTTLYWKLPRKFLGNQITSYGGKLKYDVFYKGDPRGLVNDDPDIVIEVRWNGTELSLSQWVVAKWDGNSRTEYHNQQQQ